MNYISHSDQSMDYLERAFSYTRKQHNDKLRGYADLTTTLSKNAVLSYGVSYDYNRSTNIQTNKDYIANENNDFSKRSSTEDHLIKGYIGLQGSLSRKFMYQLYLNEQYYKMELYKKSSFLPSASVTWIPEQKHILMLTLNNFCLYPNFWEKQDYVMHNSQYQVSEGNPNLRPARQFQGQLYYLFKKNTCSP